MKGGAEDEVTLDFVKSGDRWLVENYTSKRNWDRAWPADKRLLHLIILAATTLAVMVLAMP